MNARRAGILLLGIQLVLVLSIAVKYLYERKTCPRVWVRAAQYDPQLPVRGRYLAVRPSVDACNLPHDSEHHQTSYVMPYNGGRVPGSWSWPVSLYPENGTLKARIEDRRKRADDVYMIELREDRSCDKVPVQVQLLYFIPEHATNPLPLRPQQELWVEVTVPPSGPPRPIQLALSDASGFKPLKFE